MEEKQKQEINIHIKRIDQILECEECTTEYDVLKLLLRGQKILMEELIKNTSPL